MTGVVHRAWICVLLLLALGGSASADAAYPWPEDRRDGTIRSRIAPPAGYEWLPADSGSFAWWLRSLPLKPGRPPVMLYDGRRKGNQSAHHAVIDIDVGSRDLQQCADAVIRLRAEYLRSQGRGDEISFRFTSGHPARWREWRRGKRPVVVGSHVAWLRTSRADSSYGSFRRYLEKVSQYAGSMSLSRELVPVTDPRGVLPGDVFIRGGFPGHAAIVVDVAANSSGERVFLLAQSYMPAQEIHILRNERDSISPWYRALPDGPLPTPEYLFRYDELMRFTDDRHSTEHEQWTTTRERWLAAVNMQPVDRLPFWPKIDAAYPRHQAEPFRSMSAWELHRWIGSDPHEGLPDFIDERRKRTSIEETIDGKTRTKVFRTPSGEMRLVSRRDEASASWHPVEFPIRNVDDVERMTEIYADVSVEVDRDLLEECRAQSHRIGDRAVTAMGIGESPLMWFVEYLAGIENAHYLLADHREAVEALFDAMHRVLIERAHIICDLSPADLIYMVENTSTALISPTQYRTYCLMHISEYAAIARDAGRNMVLHMCGHLKDLLPDLAKLPVRAFEAFTSPPVGNTFFKDGREACPNTCLIGGTNAALWLRPAAEIIAFIERSLDELPHHRGIVVTSAGVQPPAASPATIRQVCEWVKAYPVRL